MPIKLILHITFINFKLFIFHLPQLHLINIIHAIYTFTIFNDNHNNNRFLHGIVDCVLFLFTIISFIDK